jgi:hypothetical protein
LWLTRIIASVLVDAPDHVRDRGRLDAERRIDSSTIGICLLTAPGRLTVRPLARKRCRGTTKDADVQVSGAPDADASTACDEGH